MKKFMSALRANYLPAFFILLFAICNSHIAEAQKRTPVPGYGFDWNRGRFIYALGMPNDTFYVQIIDRSYPWVAIKNNTLYHWNITTQVWEPYSQGGTCGIINPGVVTWDSLMFLNVSPAIYIDCETGIRYTTAQTQVELDAADPTDPRIDLIIADDGVISVVTGTPSANPVEPSLSPGQIKLAFVYVPAGATMPQVFQNVIYDENTESTVTTSSVTVDANNTTDPYHLTKAVSAGAVSSSSILKFTKGAEFKISNYNTITFYLKLKSAFANNVHFQLNWLRAGVAVTGTVTISNNTYGYLRSAGGYQQITIPISAFAPIVQDSADALQIKLTGTNANGFYIDWINMQGGIGQSNASGKQFAVSGQDAVQNENRYFNGRDQFFFWFDSIRSLTFTAREARFKNIAGSDYMRYTAAGMLIDPLSTGIPLTFQNLPLTDTPLYVMGLTTLGRATKILKSSISGGSDTHFGNTDLTLTANRNHALNGKTVNINEGLNAVFRLDPIDRLYTLGRMDSTFFQVDNTAEVFYGVFGNSFYNFYISKPQIRLSIHNEKNVINIDSNNIQIGNPGDYHQGIEMYNNYGGTNQFLIWNKYGARVSYDGASELYKFGDISAVNNSTLLEVDDANQNIKFKEGSLAGASNGYVWKLIDQATGEGGWQAGGGGTPTLQQVLATGSPSLLTSTHQVKLDGSNSLYIYRDVSGGAYQEGLYLDPASTYLNGAYSTTKQADVWAHGGNSTNDNYVQLTVRDGSTKDTVILLPGVFKWNQDTIATLADVRAGGGGVYSPLLSSCVNMGTTSGSTLDSTCEYTIPANTLNADGKSITWEMMTENASSGVSHIIYWYLNDVGQVNDNETVNGFVRTRITLTRTSSSAAIVTLQMWGSSDTYGVPQSALITSQDWTIANRTVVGMHCPSGGSITGHTGNIKKEF